MSVQNMLSRDLASRQNWPANVNKICGCGASQRQLPQLADSWQFNIHRKYLLSLFLMKVILSHPTIMHVSLTIHICVSKEETASKSSKHVCRSIFVNILVLAPIVPSVAVWAFWSWWNICLFLFKCPLCDPVSVTIFVLFLAIVLLNYWTAVWTEQSTL